MGGCCCAPGGGSLGSDWQAARHSSHPSWRRLVLPPALRSPQLQRLYAFSAAQHGITDAQAAEIATVFSAFDSDENGYLSLDEFQRLW